MALLLLSFLILSNCAAIPKTTTFDGKWDFIEPDPYNPDDVRACLPESDVQKLREILIRCEGASK